MRHSSHPNPKDAERVGILLACKCSKVEIATALGISVASLEKCYARELSLRGAREVGEAAAALYRAAGAGDREAIEFLDVLNLQDPKRWPLPGDRSN